MQIIKAIFLDLDGTLYPYKEVNEYAQQKVFYFLSKHLKCDEKEVSFCFKNARDMVHAALGDTASAHSRFLYFQKCIEQICGRTNFRLTREAHELFWNSFLSRAELRGGVREFLVLAKKQGKKIIIVSDFSIDIQMRKLIHFKLDTLIDYVVTSEEAGRDKPAAVMFMLALQKAGVLKEEVIHIGDDYEKDVMGADRFGISSLYFVSQDSEVQIQRSTSLVRDFKEIQDKICRS